MKSPSQAPVRSPASRLRGLSLLEVLIAVSMTSLVMAAAIMPLASSRETYRNAQRSTDLESDLRRATDRIVVELMGAGSALLSPDPSDEFGTGTLSFRKALALQAGVVQWGPLNRLALEYAENELDDGVDNNGDGLADEGNVVLTYNVGELNESSVVICRGVRELGLGETFNLADDNGNGVADERGFNIRRNGTVLEIRLTLEAAGPEGTSIQRSVATSLVLRN